MYDFLIIPAKDPEANGSGAELDLIPHGCNGLNARSHPFEDVGADDGTFRRDKCISTGRERP